MDHGLKRSRRDGPMGTRAVATRSTGPLRLSSSPFSHPPNVQIDQDEVQTQHLIVLQTKTTICNDFASRNNKLAGFLQMIAY